MPKSLFIRLLSYLLLTIYSASSFAWGSHGHRVIAQLAEAELTAHTRSILTEILDGSSLADASVWADQMRSAKDNPKFWSYDYAANWHFANIAAGESYASAQKNPRGDVWLALLACTAILQNREPEPGPVKEGLQLYLGNNLHTAEAKTFALKFLLHLLGDLHQPLHLGYLKDRGGNTIALRWAGKRTNLHALWDSQLFSSSLRRHTAALSSMLEQLDNNERRQITQATPEEWIEEALQLRAAIYSVSVEPLDQKSYTQQFQPVADLLLLKAGLRTAAYLNQIFAPDSAKP